MQEKIVRTLEVAIEPKAAGDVAQFQAALEQIAADDPRLGVTTDRESGQTILQGISEMHLEETVRLLEGIPFNVGAPQVAYRETLSRPITIDYAHKNALGGRGQFACVTIEYLPLASGEGLLFENTTTLAPEFVRGVIKGIVAQADSGLLAGFPVIDIKARLIDGKYHEINSGEFTFNIAARASFRELATRNAVILLEPVMKIVVTTPEDFLGDVIGSLNSRHGVVQDTFANTEHSTVTALVPASNLIGYGNKLQSMCQDRATYELRFDHYTPVATDEPPDRPFPGAMGMRVA